jgi:hypothetical protein
MRLSPAILIIAAVVALVGVIALGSLVLQPNRPLLANVSFNLPQISPNADGQDDVTLISYTLNRNADVTIRLTNTLTGTQFAFRDAQRRPIGAYTVGFSGVVAGYLNAGDPTDVTIDTRLIPDGSYTWEVSATADGGETANATGTLVVIDGDPVVPLLTRWEVSPTRFSPNQDGYNDRIIINVYLPKPATLTAYLSAPGLGPYYITERTLGTMPDAEGGSVHQFDYDAGVDTNVAPPPDGDYTLTVVAEDDEGQRVRREATITIVDGGLPQAEIVSQTIGRTVTWGTLPYDARYFTDASTTGNTVTPPTAPQSTIATLSLPKDDVLVFSLVVSNYGKTPIRTEGPWPGTVYQYEQTDGAMRTPSSTDFSTGAWRVGIQCERTTTSFPWRWAIGAQDQLTKVVTPAGDTTWYLMPGQRATVWGAIRMTTLYRTLNPQKCWAALIHQGVQIPFRQDRVGEIDVRLETPTQP